MSYILQAFGEAKDKKWDLRGSFELGLAFKSNIQEYYRESYFRFINCAIDIKRHALQIIADSHYIQM